MIEFLRCNRKFRKLLIRISDYLLKEAILEFLYPGNLEIEFK